MKPIPENAIKFNAGVDPVCEVLTERRIGGDA